MVRTHLLNFLTASLTAIKFAVIIYFVLPVLSNVNGVLIQSFVLAVIAASVVALPVSVICNIATRAGKPTNVP